MSRALLASALTLSLLSAPLAVAQEEAKPVAVVVKKEAWVQGMKDQLPPAFCKPTMYFRQCFSITEEQCLETAKKATESCLAQHDQELPASLQQPQDGTKWGAKVGTCAGIAFETAHKAKLSKEEKCKDASNWIP